MTASLSRSIRPPRCAGGDWRCGVDEGRGVGANALRTFKRVDEMGVALRPTLFAYQFLYELEPMP